MRPTRAGSLFTLDAQTMQALPFVEGDGPRQLGFSRDRWPVCASHSGEPMHVTQVEGMLDKAGLTYKTLQCGCHVPLFVEAGVAPAPAPGSYDERHHNCSGKHSGFLACCVQHGWPVGNYLAPAHPLQQAIRREVAGPSGFPRRLRRHRRLFGTITRCRW
jgi:L-asparaginase II